MKKNFILLISAFFLLAMQVTACNNEEEIETRQTSEQKKIRILSIGNSYSQDALMYVPFILRNMGINAEIQIGILMQGGSSLRNHVDNFNNEATNYIFQLYNGGKTWSSINNKTIQYVLDNYEWDFVIMQQVSGSSFKWSTYQPLS